MLDKEMEFSWNEENQLHYRFGDVPQTATRNLWTTFKMPLREAAPMPPVSELMQFLASSITFMVDLKDVTVFFDDYLVGQINKSLGQSQAIPIPAELVRWTPEKNLIVKSVERHRKIMLPRYEPMRMHETKMDLTVFTAQVDVNIIEKLSKELNRCTKKNPPSRLKYSLIYGHATAQTTGIGGHMASHFIPTVERESIDLVDRNVAGSYSMSEVSYVGRVRLGALQDSKFVGDAAADKLHSRASRELQDQRFIHVLKFFTFRPSTPSSKVAQLLADSFYGCSPLPLRLLSSVGVHAAPDIRLFDSGVARFLKSLPMLSEDVARDGAHFITALPHQHKIPKIAMSDVLQGLRCHTLDVEELVACLRWCITSGRGNLTSNMADLLDAATFHRPGGAIRLSSITYFVDPKVLGLYIPADGPLPLSLIPLSVSKHFGCAELATFGWKEFTITSWLQHLSRPDVMSADEKYDFTRSVDWASRVLRTLCRVWSQLSEDMRNKSREVLRNKPCIPTSKGLCSPEGSYLPIADNALFYHLDLPIVSRDSGFEVDEESFQSNEEENSRHCADELYPPVDIFRSLRLPVIEWNAKSEWSDTSPQARLLYRLGLNHFPPLPKIVELCSSKDNGVQETAFVYLCRELHSQYRDYRPEDFCDVEFIPAECKDFTCLKKLGKYSEVYTGTQWKALGFFVVQDRYLSALSAPLHQLGVMQHPSRSKLLESLEKNPPPDEKTADGWFEILFDHMSNFLPSDFLKLSELQIVPTGPSSAPRLLSHPNVTLIKKNEDQTVWEYDHQFLTYEGVTIVDDNIDYQLFGDCLFVAPPGEELQRFYASLGCSYLSMIVRESCHDLHEIPATKTCAEVQSLILERLPLFIQNYPDTKPKITIPSSPDHLKVKACKRIRVSKTLVNRNVKRTRDVWTIVRREDDCIVLWISKTQKPDMYQDEYGVKNKARKKDFVHEASNASGEQPLDTVGHSTSLPLSRTSREVISQSYIRNNVEKAINACSFGGEKLAIDAGVSQSLSSGFCKASADVGSLRPIGMPNSNTFMERMHGPLARFVDIIISSPRYIIPNNNLAYFL
ncbi:hypothetical protein BKA82DRAFT_4013016 [Pisolithus tinctorius]|nr:hypothetical protein BKA82DRAFT_4013016 [Pisolithus tinctorius]